MASNYRLRSAHIHVPVLLVQHHHGWDLLRATRWEFWRHWRYHRLRKVCEGYELVSCQWSVWHNCRHCSFSPTVACHLQSTRFASKEIRTMDVFHGRLSVSSYVSRGEAALLTYQSAVAASVASLVYKVRILQGGDPFWNVFNVFIAT